jgi:hypothetical protein
MENGDGKMGTDLFFAGGRKIDLSPFSLRELRARLQVPEQSAYNNA